MSEIRFLTSALFELRFWLQIMGDHARFIKDGLTPNEQEEIIRAATYIQAFDALLAASRQDLSEQEVLTLVQSAYPWTEQLRSFKLHLLQRHLTGKIGLNLPPTFLNHMVNEIEEALRVLAMLAKGQPPLIDGAIHQHLLWLQDAVGHAASLTSDLDPVEKKWIHQSEHFQKHFQDLYLKAIELAGYMRTALPQFPALNRFNQDANAEMLLFMKFLDELKEMAIDKTILSTLMPLIPDHMYREECYYLTKLSMVTELKQPDCNPAKPRIE